MLLSAEVYPNDFPTRTSTGLDLLTAPLSFLQYLVTSPDLIWSYIVGVPAGKGLLVVAGIGLMSVWLCRISVRRGESVPAELRAGIAAFGLLPIPLTGHATDWIYHDLMMMSMELHLIGAAAWVGGLGATIVFLSRRPHLLAVALPRFSRLATYCVFIVAASGIFSGISMLATADISVPLPQSIWTTHYGQLMIVKLLCVAVIATLAVGRPARPAGPDLRPQADRGGAVVRLRAARDGGRLRRRRRAHPLGAVLAATVARAADFRSRGRDRGSGNGTWKRHRSPAQPDAPVALPSRGRARCTAACPRPVGVPAWPAAAWRVQRRTGQVTVEATLRLRGEGDGDGRRPRGVDARSSAAAGTS